MQTRSGLDRFDRVVQRVEGDWPTVKQAQMLSIKTSDMKEFCEYFHRILNKCPQSKINSRLAVLAAAESIKKCPELHSGMPLFIMTIMAKLVGVDNKPDFLHEYIRSFSKFVI